MLPVRLGRSACNWRKSASSGSLSSVILYREPRRHRRCKSDVSQRQSRSPGCISGTKSGCYGNRLKESRTSSVGWWGFSTEQFPTPSAVAIQSRTPSTETIRQLPKLSSGPSLRRSVKIPLIAIQSVALTYLFFLHLSCIFISYHLSISTTPHRRWRTWRLTRLPLPGPTLIFPSRKGVFMRDPLN